MPLLLIHIVTARTTLPFPLPLSSGRDEDDATDDSWHEQYVPDKFKVHKAVQFCWIFVTKTKKKFWTYASAYPKSPYAVHIIRATAMHVWLYVCLCVVMYILQSIQLTYVYLRCPTALTEETVVLRVRSLASFVSGVDSTFTRVPTPYSYNIFSVASTINVLQ